MSEFRLRIISSAALAVFAAASAHAAPGIVPSGSQTQVGNAGNTPVINIAGANARGISHNTFSQFNVDQNGVVFNNLTAAGASQLAGQLAANANLGGKAAKVIVADVSSSKASELNGAMEVAGAPAHLVIANAAGISCNGCNTINAPVVTLAAARYTPTADGALAFTVDTSRAQPATISIDGEGMNVGTAQLNLLSRATLINAAVKGWDIHSLNGTEFEADSDGNFQSKLTYDAAGTKPTVALDVSELGGMYANKILLEGSEYGLGVNNAGTIWAGDGGLGVEMFGAELTHVGQGISHSEGAGYDVRTEHYKGQADEAQLYERTRHDMRADAEASHRAKGWSPEAEARLTDNAKQRKLDALVEQATYRPHIETAEERAAREADEAAKRAQADAEHEAEKAAAIARAEAEAQARAEKEAADKAAEVAQAEAAAKAAEEQAAAEAEWRERQAQEQAEYEARMAAEKARAEAEAQARAQADAEREAEWAEYNAQKQAEYEAQKAAEQAASQAQFDAEAQARAQADAEREAEWAAVAEYNARKQAEYEAQKAARQAQIDADAAGWTVVPSNPGNDANLLTGFAPMPPMPEMPTAPTFTPLEPAPLPAVAFVPVTTAVEPVLAMVPAFPQPIPQMIVEPTVAEIVPPSQTLPTITPKPLPTLPSISSTTKL
ncbi:two-partner secretion domain-containing protein [Cupriavidus pauculus]|uniref:two-partner secretion domain-containing protein n=1 Tax=Cupriavidus pauculus TaxID=82633 RepID=UPI0012473063|nr:filamentous hemagglutinin N-terminal domain-containing protein [Cupriavidus pauculus]KAB0604288.1 filamentous hemagglutinin N-terminal domain-containing protein [Cupriavidus pauculus]MCM3606584.1 filamentous hemagglutinin N-terminal domain-containing protein [Cupriavidus pauculus]UAL00669.1 filamentous hemagglutinin N-terminal domain-containing protein [Cupriavidus pauculus]